MPDRIWRFACYWWAFIGVGAVVTVAVSTFVLPVPAGYVVRKKLAKAIRLEGALLSSVVALMTDELDEKTGLLKKASGEASIATGVDSGLEPHVLPVHNMSMGASQSLQTALNHLRASRLEWDAYRSMHLFPATTYENLLILARTLLSPAMMLFYPLQTGKMRLTLCRQHARELRDLAAAFEGCCGALAEVIRYNAPVQRAGAALGALEASYVALMRAALAAQQEPAGVADALPNDLLALNMALSLLYTCCTRLRRMYALLPEALGRDQRGAAALVRRHFATDRSWDFAAMAQSSLQQGPATRLLVKQSLVGPQASTRALVAQLLDSQGQRLAPEVQGQPRARELAPEVQMSMSKLKAPGPASRVTLALRWVERHTGYNRAHLSLGLQLAVAYAFVMVLLVVSAPYHAVNERSTWTVFIVVAIHEPLAGSAVWKCVLRFGGTVVAGLLGLGALYFTYLCNGLSYENKPAKFIIMTIVLTLLSLPLAAGAVKYGVRNAYFWIISCIVMYTVALPGYTHDEPLPKYALWRLVCTAMGIAVEVLVSQLVCPVTARMAYRTTMTGTLRSLADVVDAAFHSLLPKPGSKGRTPAVLGSVGGPSLPPPPQGATNGAVAPPAAHTCAAQGITRTGTQDPGDQVPLGGPLAVFTAEVTKGSMHGSSGAPVLLPMVGRDSATAGAAGAAAASNPAAPVVAASSPRFDELSHPLNLSHQLGAGASPHLRPGLSVGSALRDSAYVPNSTEGSGDSLRGGLLPDHDGAAGRERGTTAARDGTCQLDRLSMHSAQSAHSMHSTVSGVSTYVRLDDDGFHQLVFGRLLVRLRPTAMQVGGQIAAMGQLLGPLQYEVNPFADPPRFPIKAAFRAARLCRRAMNIITAFAITMDSHHTHSVPLLAPHAATLERLLNQLQEAFRAMAGLVSGEGSIRWAVRCVVSVEAHLEALLLRVAVGEEGGGVTEGDAMQGLAFLSMLFNTSYVARLLCVALVQAFHSTSPEAQEEVAELLRDPAKWALDEKLVLLAGEILGATVNGSDPGGGGGKGGGGMEQVGEEAV
ncbi:hypothetical protein N2152v2_001561 [Parachlorella kessleri]